MTAQDLRFALRTLFRRPLFSATAVLVLAFGIGANVAIFSVVDTVLLRPLGYEDAERLVRVWESNAEKGWDKVVASPSNFYDWREQSELFEGMAAYLQDSTGFTLTGGGEAEQVRGGFATPSLFPLLGVAAVEGRTFRPEENWERSERAAVIAHGFWQRRFGADPTVVGRTVTLDGHPYQIVGVLPRGFEMPGPSSDVWVPFRWNESEIRTAEWARRAHFLDVIGKLEPGVSIEEARTELSSIAERLEREYPETNRAMEAGITPLHDWVVGDTRKPLLLMQWAVLFVLLIACANVSNLLLARGAGRSREIAVRSALGAGRSRTVRQLLLESVVLSIVGGGVGLLLGAWASRFFVGIAPEDIPRLDEVALDPRVILFACGMALLAGAVSGVIPAWSASRLNLVSSLKEGGDGAGASRKRRRTLGLFVVAEVAIALALVIGAGLLVRSFNQLQAVDPGVDPEGVLTFKLSLPDAGYEETHAIRNFYRRLETRLRAVPEVEAVAFTSLPPLGGSGWTTGLSIRGRSSQELGGQVRHKIVSPSYFKTVGIPLKAGRSFRSTDDAGSTRVVVVNESFQRRYFPGQSPLGARVAFDAEPEEDTDWFTVVGVIHDVRQDALSTEPQPEAYESYEQNPGQSRYGVVKVATDAQAVIGTVRDLVREVDSDVPVFRERTLSDILAASVARQRFLSLLLAGFGVVAIVLAGLGVFGVVTYSVSQTRREIGLRMALGASVSRVIRSVLVKGGRLVAIGCAIGLFLAVVVSRYLSTLLFEVRPVDPLTFAVVTLFFLVLGLAASLVPARQAVRVDPMISLRSE